MVSDESWGNKSNSKKLENKNKILEKKDYYYSSYYIARLKEAAYKFIFKINVLFCDRMRYTKIELI